MIGKIGGWVEEVNTSLFPLSASLNLASAKNLSGFLVRKSERSLRGAHERRQRVLHAMQCKGERRAFRKGKVREREGGRSRCKKERESLGGRGSGWP